MTYQSRRSLPHKQKLTISTPAVEISKSDYCTNKELFQTLTMRRLLLFQNFLDGGRMDEVQSLRLPSTAEPLIHDLPCRTITHQQLHFLSENWFPYLFNCFVWAAWVCEKSSKLFVQRWYRAFPNQLKHMVEFLNKFVGGTWKLLSMEVTFSKTFCD